MGGAQASGGPGLGPLKIKKKKKERKEYEKKKISVGKMKERKIKWLREQKNSKLQFWRKKCDFYKN